MDNECQNRDHADEEDDGCKVRITENPAARDQECNPANHKCPALPIRGWSPTEPGWFRLEPVLDCDDVVARTEHIGTSTRNEMVIVTTAHLDA